MRRIAIFFTLVVFCAAPAVAQKLVIGSRAAAFKPDRDLWWMTSAPPEKKGMLIDFYSSKNPSCVKFYTNLDEIAKKLNGKFSIAIISRTDDEAFRDLVALDGGKYHFAVDAQGKSYTAFGVQYLPYTVLLNDVDEVLWQGNLSKFAEIINEKIK